MSDAKHPAGHELQAYHDRELEATRSAEVAAHCRRCASCQAELADLERVDNLLAAAPVPEMPRTIWHRVKPERRQASRLRPSLALAAGAAGVALGALIGPIGVDSEVPDTDLAWTESVTVWNAGVSASLFSAYQSEQD